MTVDLSCCAFFVKIRLTRGSKSGKHVDYRMKDIIGIVLHVVLGKICEFHADLLELNVCGVSIHG